MSFKTRERAKRRRRAQIAQDAAATAATDLDLSAVVAPMNVERLKVVDVVLLTAPGEQRRVTGVTLRTSRPLRSDEELRMTMSLLDLVDAPTIRLVGEPSPSRQDWTFALHGSDNVRLSYLLVCASHPHGVSIEAEPGIGRLDTDALETDDDLTSTATGEQQLCAR